MNYTKIVDIRNRENAKNIDLLCNMMEEKEAWNLVKHIFQDIYGNCVDNEIGTPQTEKFHEQLQNFKSNPDFPNIVINENKKKKNSEF